MRCVPFVLLLASCGSDIVLDQGSNLAPAAVINTPADGATFFDTDVVELAGTVADGNGLDDLASVLWTSTLDGELGTADPDVDGITRLSTSLSPGTHGIALTVTDRAGTSAQATIDLVIVEEPRAPEIVFDSPAEFAEFYPDDPVDLLGTVVDGQDPPEALTVTWTVTDNATNQIAAAFPSTVSAAGLTHEVWTAGPQGNYRIELSATDTDGNVTAETRLVVVKDPNFADRDGDGYFPATGDCDDFDAATNPGADETCGDGDDRDCSSVPDDKDLDKDGHVDAACLSYPGADDCLDDNPLVYGSSPEVLDGIDNDCDGAIDDGTTAYDDDGDCFCEIGPCAGSVEPLCAAVVTDGDCDDTTAATSPGVFDTPDPTYADENCDGIDGDLLDAVFLDPLSGSDANSGLDPFAPKRTLAAANSAAAGAAVSWILVAPGILDFTIGSFVEGLNLAGGYDTTWVRSALHVPEISVPSTGKLLSGWSDPTEWHQIRIKAASTTLASASSLAIVLDQTVGLTLVDVQLEAGGAGPGTAGGAGTVGSPGSNGGTGSNGCEDSSFICSSCSDPKGGTAGGGCTAASNGGKGGDPGLGGGNGAVGASGLPVGAGGGPGGPAGVGHGVDGTAGTAGAIGAEGSAGAGAGLIGTFTAAGYTPANGTAGGAGKEGAGGGGGGGGAGGGWTFGNCDTWGGGGGGGGGGGCGGTGGSVGTGGGASVALVLLNGSAVTVDGGTIRTATAGNGGGGGTGGTGGGGGLGRGGGSGTAAIINEVSGDGGTGGNGGAGGRGGHGGGGTGGPSVGIVCRGGSTAVVAGVSYVIGTAGAAGGGAGASGSAGTKANTDGC